MMMEIYPVCSKGANSVKMEKPGLSGLFCFCDFNRRKDDFPVPVTQKYSELYFRITLRFFLASSASHHQTPKAERGTSSAFCGSSDYDCYVYFSMASALIQRPQATHLTQGKDSF